MSPAESRCIESKLALRESGSGHTLGTLGHTKMNPNDAFGFVPPKVDPLMSYHLKRLGWDHRRAITTIRSAPEVKGAPSREPWMAVTRIPARESIPVNSSSE